MTQFPCALNRQGCHDGSWRSRPAPHASGLIGCNAAPGMMQSSESVVLQVLGGCGWKQIAVPGLAAGAGRAPCGDG